MSSVRKKYLHFQAYLMLKGFSIIGILIFFGFCQHHGGSVIRLDIPVVEKKWNEVVLHIEIVPVINEQVQIKNLKELVYVSFTEIICDYGVIFPFVFIEPPESNPKKYDIRLDIENS